MGYRARPPPQGKCDVVPDAGLKERFADQDPSSL